MQAIKM